MMPFVKLGDVYWNLSSIARMAPMSDPTKTGWASWVAAVITLASGKEFGVSKEDFQALAKEIETTKQKE